jgi:hypothetical protein
VNTYYNTAAIEVTIETNSFGVSPICNLEKNRRVPYLLKNTAMNQGIQKVTVLSETFS